jgi:hypothetical protein
VAALYARQVLSEAERTQEVTTTKNNKEVIEATTA